MQNKKLWKTGLITTGLLLGMQTCVWAADYKETLTASLTELTSETRGAGLEGEANQLQKLADRMAGYGYEISEDVFDGTTRMGETFTSKNLIAKKKAESENADIMVVSAHIDSIASTVGADDDASGVAVLEAVAKDIADDFTDTEIWFVIFSGEEEGLLGSNHFAAQITEEEKSRMIGDIQLDMLGHYLTNGLEVNTANGKSNLVAEMLIDSITMVTGDEIEITQEKSSDHVSFAENGIPAVMLNQKGDGYENHEIMDDMSQIDLDKLETSAAIVGEALWRIMSEDTIDLAKEVWEDEDYENKMAGYLSNEDEIIDIDTSLQGMINNMGTVMKKVSEQEDEVLGTVATYEGKIYWLDMDTPLTTDFLFYNEQFQNAEIKAYEAGYSAEDMQDMISDLAGEPEISKTDQNQDSYFWSWALNRTGYQMDMQEDGSYILTIAPCSEGNLELGEINLDESGNPVEELDDNTQKIWDDIIANVIREEDRAAYMDKFVLFTDGVRYVTGFTDPAEPDDEKNSMWLDLNDLLDPEGEYRHYYKSVSTVIHEYGHVLGMNATQLDVAANGEDSYSLPPYEENSYMTAFMEQFYPDLDVNDSQIGPNHVFREHPDEFVSLYASDKTREDFAESFKCFVMMEKQNGDTVAQKKVNFFYDYPEMVEIRTWIRSNFDWLE